MRKYVFSFNLKHFQSCGKRTYRKTSLQLTKRWSLIILLFIITPTLNNIEQFFWCLVGRCKIQFALDAFHDGCGFPVGVEFGSHIDSLRHESFADLSNASKKSLQSEKMTYVFPELKIMNYQEAWKRILKFCQKKPCYE